MQTASAIMMTKVVTATPETSVAEIAGLLLEHKISAVSVIDASKASSALSAKGICLAGHPRTAREAGGCGFSEKTRGVWRRSRLPGI
jgi:CBS domain-containing protein